MSADDKARKLAEKMALDVIKAYFECKEVEYLLPYAAALLAAEEALDEAVDYLSDNPPANSYGLLDRETDKERSWVLSLARAALSTIKGLLP